MDAAVSKTIDEAEVILRGLCCGTPTETSCEDIDGAKSTAEAWVDYNTAYPMAIEVAGEIVLVRLYERGLIYEWRTPTPDTLAEVRDALSLDEPMTLP